MIRHLSLINALSVAAADCVVDGSFDYIGFDVGGAAASDAGECCDLCQQHKDCKFYTFKEWDTTASYCYLKSSNTNKTADTNRLSGAAVGCSLDHGFDYWGSDMGGANASSAAECCSMCNAYPKCAFFSFLTDENYCHLKTSNEDRRPNDKRISGSRTGGPPAPPPPPSDRPDFANSCTQDLKGGPRLPHPFCNASLPLEERMADLLSRMTYLEKTMALNSNQPAVPRLGVPSMRSGESTHGVSTGGGDASPNSTGCPTSFPSGVGLGAAFDKELYRAVGDVIGTEARALSNQNGKAPLYFLDPNINLQRDPRWGRSQEVPGEDPHLTAEFGVALVTATQELEGEGLDERYVRVGATVKHFSMYDLEGYDPRTNPEPGPNSSYCETPGGCERWNFVAWPPSRDFVGYYMSPWETVLKRARPTSIMCSYNSAYGEPTCASDEMNNGLVRKTWGWDGFFVSDCTALELLQNVKWDNCEEPYPSQGGSCTPQLFKGGHNYTFTPGDTCHATLVEGGIDHNCGALYKVQLNAALESGHVMEADIDLAVSRVYALQFRLGLLDPMEGQRYLSIPKSAVDSAQSRAVALLAAEESMVLLKNDGRLLPLDESGSVAFIGPHATSTQALLSNYHGKNKLVDSHSPLMAAYALANASKALSVAYARGCNICDSTPPGNTPCPQATDESMIPEAVEAAKAADTAVLLLGLDQTSEAESFDRRDLLLPGVQERLLAAVLAVQPRTVVVLVHGGPLAGDWMRGEGSVPAILDAFYPGELGGDAIVNTLFGRNSPAGRLPYTMYDNSIVERRDIRDVDLKSNGGLTYWWFEGEPLFPFAHGLSYTTFAFDVSLSGELSLDIQQLLKEAAGDLDHAALEYSVQLTNTGSCRSDCVVTAFLCRGSASPADTPLRKLVAFERARSAEPGEHRTVDVRVTLRDLSVVDAKGRRLLKPGAFQTELGDGQATSSGSVTLTGSEALLEANEWAEVMQQKPEHSHAPREPSSSALVV